MVTGKLGPSLEIELYNSTLFRFEFPFSTLSMILNKWHHIIKIHQPTKNIQACLKKKYQLQVKSGVGGTPFFLAAPPNKNPPSVSVPTSAVHVAARRNRIPSASGVLFFFWGNHPVVTFYMCVCLKRSSEEILKIGRLIFCG